MKKYEEMTTEEKVEYLRAKRQKALELMKTEKATKVEVKEEPKQQPKKEVPAKQKKQAKKSNGFIKGVAVGAVIVIGASAVAAALKGCSLQTNDENIYNSQTTVMSIDEQIEELKTQTGNSLDLEEDDYKNYVLALNDQTLEEDYSINQLAQTANEISSYNTIELTNNYAYNADQLTGTNVNVAGEGKAKDYLEKYYELRNTLFDSIKSNSEKSVTQENALNLYKYIVKTLANKEKIDLDGNIFDINSLDEETSKLIIYDMTTNDLALINTILNRPELTMKTTEGESPLPYKAVEDTILYDYTEAYETLVNCYEGYAKTK